MIEASPGTRSGDSGHFLDELRATFAARANQKAIQWHDGSLTYRELDRLARCWASALQDLGVEPGDRVAIMTPEKLPFLGAHLGTLYAGAVSLPLNPRFTRDELRYFLEDSGARVVVAGDDQCPVIESLRPELPELRAIVPDAQPTARSAKHFLRARGRPRCTVPDALQLGHDRPAQGRRAHARQPRLQLCGLCSECWRFTPDDVLVNVLPLFHIHGLSFATHLSLLTGSCMLMAQSFPSPSHA